MLLQADTVDETIQWLRGYLETLSARTAPDAAEQVLVQPAGAPAAQLAQVPPGETLGPAEIPTPVLAEAHSAGKV